MSERPTPDNPETDRARVVMSEWPFDPVEDLPYATPHLPGVGGFIKHRFEDFLVEEIPAYTPAGEGEHCYLFVEKHGLAMSDMLEIIADHFGVERDAIGYAGMKDKYALTRQVISIHTPGRSIDDFPMLDRPGIAVLWADMHTNKLRVGHLRGNRFSVKIRGVDSTLAVQAKPILDALARSGLPNYYGPQRFGARLNNHEVGRADLLGDHEAVIELMLGPSARFPPLGRGLSEAYRDGRYADALASTAAGQRAEREILRALAAGQNATRAVRCIGLLQRRFFLSAFQSAVFNRVCAHRLEEGLLDRLLPGDLAAKHANNAVFRVGEDELSTNAARAELERRLRGFEISPSGPMWGPEMPRAEGEPAMIEDEALHETQVSVGAIEGHTRRLKSRLNGTRRPLRVPVIDHELEAGVDEVGHYIRCAFELPAGAFATTLVREIIKDGPRESPGTIFTKRRETNDDAQTDHDHDAERDG